MNATITRLANGDFEVARPGGCAPPALTPARTFTEARAAGKVGLPARIIRDTLALAVIVACEWLMIVLLAASNG